MKLVDTDETVLIVTGTSITAEDRDRPLAYWLKDEIDKRGVGHTYRRAIVVGDAWYLDNRIFHMNPTIAVGGPGANALAQQLVGELSTLWSEDERTYIQGDFNGERKRASLWGMDTGATAAAVESFVIRGYLDDLLQRIWKFRTGVFV
jgi:hypothetical protein